LTGLPEDIRDIDVVINDVAISQGIKMTQSLNYKTLAFALALALSFGAVAPAAFAAPANQPASQEANTNTP
jgi:hypothetical protein